MANVNAYNFYDYEDDNYKQVRSNSVRRENREKQRQEYNKSRLRLKNRIKKIIIGFALTALVAAGGKVVYTDYIQPEISGAYVNSSYSAGSESLHDNTHRTQNYEGYWYDTSAIAADIEVGEDIDSYIYGVYSSMSAERFDNMNSFIYYLHNAGLVEESNFQEYCLNRGLKKEVDGQTIADVDAYKSWAKNHIRALNNLNECIESIGAYEDSKDYDSYIYQLYTIAGWNSESKIDVLDLFLESSGTTFDEYLTKRGFTKEENGKIVIDYKAYEKAAENYVNTLENMEKEQDIVDEFRYGK